MRSAPPVTFEQRSVKLFDCFATMRSHSPNVGEICILVKNHGESVGIELREGLAHSCDQLANGLFVPTLHRRICRAADR